MRTFFHQAIVAGLLAATGGTVTATHADDVAAHMREASKAYYRAVIDSAPARGEADNRLFAAQLAAMADDVSGALPDRVHLVEHVFDTAGDDAVAWWRLLSHCRARAATCDDASIVERLRNVEPDNASAWLAGLETTQDAAANETALAGAAAASHASFHLLEMTRRNRAALARVPIPDALRFRNAERDAPMSDDEITFTAALGFSLATNLPSFESLMSLCKDAVPASMRRTRCDAIAQILSTGSDSLLERQIGNRLAFHLADSPAALAEAERECIELTWLMLASVELHGRTRDDRDALAEFIAHHEAPGATELSVVHDLLDAHDVPHAPPAHMERPSHCTRRHDN